MTNFPYFQDRIWVRGEEGANSYLVAPGASIVLWDSESPTIYIKSADARGIPTMEILDYTKRAPAKTEVELLREELDELKNLLKGVAKNESDADNADANKPKK